MHIPVGALAIVLLLFLVGSAMQSRHPVLMSLVATVGFAGAFLVYYG